MTENKKRWLRFGIQMAVIAVLIVFDAFLKQVAEARLMGKGTFVLIKGVLGFTYTRNTGAAFSMFSSSTAVLTVITGIALVGGVLALALIKKKPLIYDICVPLIIAGGAGNQLDRLTRGYVIDYIHTLFIDFPVFNFADCLITCACFAVMIYLICDLVRDRKKPPKEDAPND